MRHNLILTGDINLLGVTDPAVPFARVQDRFALPTWCSPTWNAAFMSRRVNALPRTRAFTRP